MASQAKSQPTWTDVKAKLASFDRKGLLGLIQDLYAAHKDNQMFLHARFGLGEDALSPYKETIARWLWPDTFRNQDTSVSLPSQNFPLFLAPSRSLPADFVNTIVFLDSGLV